MFSRLIAARHLFANQAIRPLMHLHRIARQYAVSATRKPSPEKRWPVRSDFQSTTIYSPRLVEVGVRAPYGRRQLPQYCASAIFRPSPSAPVSSWRKEAGFQAKGQREFWPEYDLLIIT